MRLASPLSNTTHYREWPPVQGLKLATLRARAVKSKRPPTSAVIAVSNLGSLPDSSGLCAGCGHGNILLRRVHLCINVCEERSGKVSLSSVRDHCKHRGALWRLLANLKRRGNSGAARGPAEDAFHTCELHCGFHSFFAVHQKDLVLELEVQPILRDLWDEVWSPALDGVRGPGRVALCRSAKLAENLLPLLLDATGDQGRSLGLGQDDLDVRASLLDDLAGTLEGATSAVTGDPIVQPAAGEIREDLWSRGLRMVGRVCLVLELPSQVPAVLLGKLLSLEHHACAAQGRRCHDDLCSQHAHDLPALHRERGSHRGDKVVATLCAHHGQCNAGVSTRCLDHGTTRLQCAPLLSILDDCDRQTVLHRAEGVEKFALDVEVDACGS
mmetsp:Transcript_844/g.872  ORF Transcript_844/g.872 Transcript_844/m.872 type:complete len:384 (+) Transcript_844:3-1154(+)